jgi:hypothetical protein
LQHSEIARRRVTCSSSSGAACSCAQAQKTGAIIVDGGEFLSCVLPILYPVAQVRKPQQKLYAELVISPTVEAIAPRTSRGSPSGPKSTNAIGASNAGESAWAAAVATVVLPMPPGPTIVTKRCVDSASVTL